MKLTEAIQLDIDERNDLDFSIRVEGAANAATSVRMVLENEDFSYMFKGRLTDEANVVKFSIPSLKHIKEGMYPARVEVIVDNKIFLPVEFDIDLKRPVSVVVEQVQVARRVESTTPINVHVSPQVKHTVVREKAPIEQSNKQTISLKQRYEQKRR